MQKIIYILTVSLMLTACEVCEIREIEAASPSEECMDLYGLKSYQTSSGVVELGLENFQLKEPFSSTILDEAIPNVTAPNSPKQFSAFNKVTNEYFYSHYFGPNELNSWFESTVNPYSIDSKQTDLEIVAPVYYGERLYFIDVSPNTSFSGFFDIYFFDPQQNLAMPVSQSYKYITNSYMFDQTMTSAVDNDGHLYFISGGNLITFNTTSNSLDFKVIDEGFLPNENELMYYGLVFDESENRLLALRSKINTESSPLELVAISLEGQITPLLDLTGKTSSTLSPNERFSNQSTTIDGCSHSYIIAESVLPQRTQTKFYSINLDNLAVTESLVDGDYYGIESKK